MTALPREPLTQAEFLVWELAQPDKHEYVDGYVEPLFGDGSARSQAGGTSVHSQIALELAAIIVPRARPCRVFGSDVLIETWRSSRYADLAVTCDPSDWGAATAIRHPKLIVEVLSESTAKIDLGVKLREYETIVELEEYVTIDSRKRWARVSRREGGRLIAGPAISGGALDLRSVMVGIDLDELYDGSDVALEATRTNATEDRDDSR